MRRQRLIPFAPALHLRLRTPGGYCERPPVQNRRLNLRNAQHFGEDFLIRRWREIEKDPRKNDRVARETAINALRHRPLEIVGLAVETYMGYWNPGSIQRYARTDPGYAKMNDGRGQDVR